MILTETHLLGAFLIEPEPIRDYRGFFARVFCRSELAARGLCPDVDQCSVSFNAQRGTLRGMHFQVGAHAEDKIVRVTAGAIFDVIVDVRPQSATFRQWFGAELTAENRTALYVPKGFAHGFLTLVDATEVYYMISAPFAPGSGRGFRWDDPEVAISWPLAPAVISERDASYPLLSSLSGE